MIPLDSEIRGNSAGSSLRKESARGINQKQLSCRISDHVSGNCVKLKGCVIMKKYSYNLPSPEN